MQSEINKKKRISSQQNTIRKIFLLLQFPQKLYRVGCLLRAYNEQKGHRRTNLSAKVIRPAAVCWYKTSCPALRSIYYPIRSKYRIVMYFVVKVRSLPVQTRGLLLHLPVPLRWLLVPSINSI